MAVDQRRAIQLREQHHRERLGRHGRVELVSGFLNVNSKALYRCVEHGEEHEALPNNVAAGRGLHCCRVAAGRHGKHHMTGTPTWRSWEGMRARCRRPTDPEWLNYGGRGICVCQRWTESFEAFFEDMGERPPGRTLDRIDRDGDYEPGNCRWATLEEQNNNKRSNRIVKFMGQQMTVAQAARASGIPAGTLKARLYKGWDESRLFMTGDDRRAKR